MGNANPAVKLLKRLMPWVLFSPFREGVQGSSARGTPQYEVKSIGVRTAFLGTRLHSIGFKVYSSVSQPLAGLDDSRVECLLVRCF